jgi:pyruvate/2-oxoglutarate dehydrogenase complex dihydrolipoamide acyltransferase (E2) component
MALKLFVEIDADSGRLRGEVRSAGGELDRFGRRAERSGRRARSFGDGLERVRRRVLVLTAALGAAAFAAVRVGMAFIAPSREAEGYRLRLVALLRSQSEANRLFEEAAKLAGNLPFEYREVMASATQLSGVLRGGADEVLEFLPLIADLAAVTGLTFQETTEQVVRMVSAGAASADLFRERGVLAMLGFQAGVSTSAEDTRKKLFEEWNKAGSQFKGAARDLATTWDGLMSMFSDRWFQFRQNVMDRGPFEFIKNIGAEVLAGLEANAGGLDALAQKLADGIVSAIKGVLIGLADTADFLAPIFDTAVRGVNNLFTAFNSLPPIIQEIGLLGFLFLGAWGKAGIVAIAAFWDDIVKSIGAWINFVRTLRGQDLVAMPDPAAAAKGLLDTINSTATGVGIDLKTVSLFGRETGADAAGGFGARMRELLANAELRGLSKLTEVFPPTAAPAAAAAGPEATKAQLAAAKRVFEETRTAAERYGAELEELHALYRIGAIDQDTFLRATAKARKELEGAAAGTDALTEAIKDAAQPISTAFEDAIVGGEKLIDTLNALDETLQRIVLRTLVTNPFEDFVEEQAKRIVGGNTTKGQSGAGGGLGGILTNLVGSLFGGHATGPNAITFGDLRRTADIPLGQTFTEDIFLHSGGIAGAEGARRPVDPRLFIAAPRYHLGGLAGDEVAAILKRDEGVFTPEQMKALGGRGGGRAIVQNFNFPNSSPDDFLRSEKQVSRAAARVSLRALRPG